MSIAKVIYLIVVLITIRFIPSRVLNHYQIGAQKLETLDVVSLEVLTRSGSHCDPGDCLGVAQSGSSWHIRTLEHAISSIAS